MYGRILVGYDGSEGSHRALRHALALAKRLGSEIWALWVREALPQYPDSVEEVLEVKEAADAFFQKIKEEVHSLAEKHGVPIQIDARPGHPAKILVSYAEAGGFDLIILGSRGHSSLWGRLLGHTAVRVSEHAPCNVLIVRQV